MHINEKQNAHKSNKRFLEQKVPQPHMCTGGIDCQMTTHFELFPFKLFTFSLNALSMFINLNVSAVAAIIE